MRLHSWVRTLSVALTLGILACEAGPPAFDDPPVDPGPASGTAVDGEVVRGDGVASDDDVTSVDTSVPAAPEADGGVTEPDSAVPPAPRPASTSSIDYRAAEPPGLRVEQKDWGTERFPYPDAVRGIYLNAWASGSSTRMEALLDLARRTEINTFVIDIKDATGYISHRTEIPLAHEIGATEEIRIRDLPGLLARLEEEGIYPIARIVIVKDPLLIAARPELAVQDTAGGVWVDSSDIIWLNPFHGDVWEYHLDIAKEVAAMGFPEIQWDYVRFPDAPRADLERAVFQGADGRTKAQGIRAFLNHARAELAEIGVMSTADVFGVTTSSARDVGIGQVWEALIDVVDAALPMVYPSHYWQGSFGIQRPNAYPYEVVYRAMRDASRRSAAVEGAGVTRPFLQDFTLGQPRYEAPEVRAQIEATYDAGIREWVMWNPGSRYTEEAYAPDGGWPADAEPLMRVAGGVHPVSRRHVVIDSVRTAQAQAEARARALRDSLNALPVDTVPTDAADVDADGGLPDATSRPGTLDVATDTVQVSEPDTSDAVATDTLRAPSP
jgi:hypothetical protein